MGVIAGVTIELDMGLYSNLPFYQSPTAYIVEGNFRVLLSGQGTGSFTIY
jgi:hypothetical protein